MALHHRPDLKSLSNICDVQNWGLNNHPEEAEAVNLCCGEAEGHESLMGRSGFCAT